jgi:fructose-1,6-bisphosphatase/inositol monophosphatase family enzyme
LVSDSARTYVLVNYERMTQSSDALLSHLRGDSHTAVDDNVEQLVRDGLRQDVSHV